MQKLKDNIIYFIKETDKILLLLCILTSAFGVLMVYSATRVDITDGSLISKDALKMIIAILVGVLIALLISLVDYEIILKLWPVIAVICILLMIAVFVFGNAPTQREDARTWLDFGFFSFQPSEILKIGFVITFSLHLDLLKKEINKLKNVLLLAGHAIIPFGLVLVSGDAGSALVFLLLAICMVYVAGIDWKYMLAGGVLALAAIPLVWVKLGSFQKERFLAVINPEIYPKTAFQQNLGIKAISSGGFFGEGLFKGAYTQSKTLPVPESKNDMIFTVIGEELGFIGCFLALGLIALIILKIVRDGKKSNGFAGYLICYGIAFILAIQTIINVAMCLRVGPVIGITLPFFSSGGSSSLCVYIGIGLVFSVYRSSQKRAPVNYRMTGISTPFMDI